MPGYQFDVEGARKAGKSDGEIADYLAGKTGFDIVKARKAGAHDADIIKYIASPAPGSQSVAKEAQSQLNVDPANIISTGVGAAAGAGATLFPATLPFASVIGSGTMSAVDKFLGYITGRDQYEGPLKTTADIVTGTAANEIGGRALAAPFKLAKAAVNLGNAVPNPLTHPFVPGADSSDIMNLSPTVAQYLRSKGSKYAGIADSFENLLAPNSKTAAVKNSFNLAKDAGDEFIASLTGRKGLELKDADKLAQSIQDAAGNQATQLKVESNLRGELVKMIAQANPEVTPIMELKDSGLIDQNGKKVISNVKTGDRTVYGPVSYDNTMQALIKLKDSMMNPNLKPDPQSPILKAINDIFEGVNAKFDDKGKLISFDKTDFSKAWADKQIAGKLGFEVKSLPDNVQTAFKNVNGAIDTDIKDSFSNWAKGGDKALDLFNEANTIVQKRNALFSPKEEVGKSIDDLINNSNGAKANVYAILDDPKKLENFLSSGKIVIPDGTNGGVTNIKYISSNARRDAQGATFQRALNGATNPSPVDPTNNIFNPVKLMSFINDPEKQDAFKSIFGSEGLSNVKQLFKNIAFTSEKGGNIGASRYLGLKAGTYGVSLGSGVATALTAGRLTSAAISGGVGMTVTLGAHTLAKAMTNPESARLLIQMAQGEPLGMSVNLATKILANSLRGQAVTLTYSDGNSVDGKINQDGKFVIPFNLNLGQK